MSYQLWNTRSRNLVDAFDSERDALLAVVAAVDAHGWEYVERLLLVSEGRAGVTTTLAAGGDLLRLAAATTGSPTVEEAIVGHTHE